MTGRDTPALREQALFQQDPARKWSKKRRAWRTGRSCWRRLRIAIGELQRASGSHVGRGPAPGGGGGWRGVLSASHSSIGTSSQATKHAALVRGSGR